MNRGELRAAWNYAANVAERMSALANELGRGPELGAHGLYVSVTTLLDNARFKTTDTVTSVLVGDPATEMDEATAQVGKALVINARDLEALVTGWAFSPLPIVLKVGVGSAVTFGALLAVGALMPARW
jgi:hypothetical protein